LSFSESASTFKVEGRKVDEPGNVTRAPEVRRLLERAREDGAILALLLFGSRARGEATSASDIDLRIVLHPERDTAEERVRVRLASLPSEKMDIRLFPQLPLNIRKRVLKEGVVLFAVTSMSFTNWPTARSKRPPTFAPTITATSSKSHVLDRERVLAKLDELDGYVVELNQVVPEPFEEYKKSVADRRACERLLQISAECILDVCSLFVSGLRLGLPAEDNDLVDKLERAGVFSSSLAELLRSIRGFRNLLVHEYGRSRFHRPQYSDKPIAGLRRFQE
jgi:uncharacterized protein YutE (UPF0331/DUF86 family)/predicted nucleotidyltransferase